MPDPQCYDAATKLRSYELAPTDAENGTELRSFDPGRGRNDEASRAWLTRAATRPELYILVGAWVLLAVALVIYMLVRLPLFRVMYELSTAG